MSICKSSQLFCHITPCAVILNFDAISPKINGVLPVWCAEMHCSSPAADDAPRPCTIAYPMYNTSSLHCLATGLLASREGQSALFFTTCPRLKFAEQIAEDASKAVKA